MCLCYAKAEPVDQQNIVLTKVKQIIWKQIKTETTIQKKINTRINPVKIYLQVSFLLIFVMQKLVAKRF